MKENGMFGKKDYGSYIIVSLISLMFYLLSEAIFTTRLIPFVACGLGGMLGTALASYVYEKSNKSKYSIIAGLLILLICGISIIDVYEKSLNTFAGTWETEHSSEGFVRLRFDSTDVYLSSSPHFNEVKYFYSLEKHDSILLSKDDEIKLRFKITDRNSSKFSIANEDDELIFFKKEKEIF